jgi:D-glycero-alpha-D-manno-heptose 1-phosphate guanylyltransferase
MVSLEASGPQVSIPRGIQTCIVLAGGLGTRLRGVIHDRPKCLAPVGNRTFLEIQIDRLAQAGITAVVLSLGYGAEQVIQALKCTAPAVPVRYVVESELLGTGGAITHALDALALDEVLVANGDTYLDGDLSRMLEPLNRDGGELFRMAGVVVPDRSRFGGVEADTAARVVGFLEKGQVGGGLINAGLYRLCRAALPRGRAGAYSLEADILPVLVQLRSVTLEIVSGAFIDIGIPADYARFCAIHAI